MMFALTMNSKMAGIWTRADCGTFLFLTCSVSRNWLLILRFLATSNWIYRFSVQ